MLRIFIIMSYKIKPEGLPSFNFYGPVKIFGQIKFVKFENYPLNDVGGEWSVAERGSHIVGAARRALMLPPDVFHSTLSAFQVRLTCGICACCKTRKRIGKSLFSLPFSF